jgi:rhomboid protease GluP
MWRQREGSVLCPSCGQLVGVNDEVCLSCGRRRPGLFGFAALLRNFGRDLGFVPIVLWACGALYISALAIDPSAIGMRGGIFSLLAPTDRSLIILGASGPYPVIGFGRWWTFLSAAWLHGSVLHIVFNMMAVRDLVPPLAHLYGASRTVILYTVAAITGFAASTFAGAYLLFLPSFLSGSRYITVGASASVFGLIGALAYYGRRGGSALISEHAKRWALGGLLFGVMVPGIDNWAHIGGFAGGYLTGRFLDPLTPERGDHFMAAVGCLALSAASVLASVVTAR